MEVNSKDAVARSSLRLGHEYLTSKDYGRAFAHFSVALHLRGDFSVGLEDTFASCLCDWGKRLEELQRYDDLFKCYKTAMELYPDNKVILYNIGAHLLRIDHYKEAARYFKKSLLQDSNFLPPYKGLQNVSSLVVERWQFRMLNDSKRNTAFRDAISKVIRKERHSLVLDIGCGTGILSMFAADAGADRVYACEHNEVMASLADEIIKKNLMAGKIRVINKTSQNLSIPGDLPERVSLVVTETFDAGLIGEGVLLFIKDALQRLSKLTATVLPRRAIIYGTLLESAELARKYKTLRMPRTAAAPPELFATGYEPYDTCHLSSLDDAVYMSSDVRIFSIDLGDLDALNECIKGLTEEVTFVCGHSGFVDFVAVWFELELCEGVSISTHPREGSCWDQAVFPISGARFLHKGDSVPFRFSIKGDKFTMDQESEGRVSISAVSFLNDSKTTSEYETWLSSLELPQEASILQVLPYHIAFPLDDCDGNISVVSATSSDSLAQLDLLSASGKNERLKFYTVDDLEQLLESQKYHAIAINFTDSCGELDENLIQMIPLFRLSLSSCGGFSGEIFPSNLTVYCQLISSDELYACSMLIDDKASTKFKGFDALNDFKCCQMVSLRRGELGIVPASAAVALANLSLEQLCADESSRFSAQTDTLAPVHGIAYWFTPKTSNSSGAVAGDISSKYHWADLAVQMVHPPFKNVGSPVQIDLLYRMGIVKLSLRLASD